MKDSERFFHSLFVVGWSEGDLFCVAFNSESVPGNPRKYSTHKDPSHASPPSIPKPSESSFGRGVEPDPAPKPAPAQ